MLSVSVCIFFFFFFFYCFSSYQILLRQLRRRNFTTINRRRRRCTPNLTNINLLTLHMTNVVPWNARMRSVVIYMLSDTFKHDETSFT
jgi:hypothetical protein